MADDDTQAQDQQQDSKLPKNEEKDFEQIFQHVDLDNIPSPDLEDTQSTSKVPQPKQETKPSAENLNVENTKQPTETPPQPSTQEEPKQQEDTPPAEGQQDKELSPQTQDTQQDKETEIKQKESVAPGKENGKAKNNTQETESKTKPKKKRRRSRSKKKKNNTSQNSETKEQNNNGLDIDDISAYIQQTKSKQSTELESPRASDNTELKKLQDIYAVVPHAKGDHKLVFFNDKAPKDLLEDDKGRTKGSVYAKKDMHIYDVKVDFKHHAKLKSKNGDPLTVWLIDDPDEMSEQIKAIQLGKGGGTNFGTPHIVGFEQGSTTNISSTKESTDTDDTLETQTKATSLPKQASKPTSLEQETPPPKKKRRRKKKKPTKQDTTTTLEDVKKAETDTSKTQMQDASTTPKTTQEAENDIPSQKQKDTEEKTQPNEEETKLLTAPEEKEKKAEDEENKDESQSATFNKTEETKEENKKNLSEDNPDQVTADPSSLKGKDKDDKEAAPPTTDTQDTTSSSEKNFDSDAENTAEAEPTQQDMGTQEVVSPQKEEISNDLSDTSPESEVSDTHTKEDRVTQDKEGIITPDTERASRETETTDNNDTTQTDSSEDTDKEGSKQVDTSTRPWRVSIPEESDAKDLAKSEPEFPTTNNKESLSATSPTNKQDNTNKPRLAPKLDEKQENEAIASTDVDTSGHNTKESETSTADATTSSKKPWEVDTSETTETDSDTSQIQPITDEPKKTNDKPWLAPDLHTETNNESSTDPGIDTGAKQADSNDVSDASTSSLDETTAQETETPVEKPRTPPAASLEKDKSSSVDDGNDTGLSFANPNEKPPTLDTSTPRFTPKESPSLDTSTTPDTSNTSNDGHINLDTFLGDNPLPEKREDNISTTTSSHIVSSLDETGSSDNARKEYSHADHLIKQNAEYKKGTKTGPSTIGVLFRMVMFVIIVIALIFVARWMFFSTPQTGPVIDALNSSGNTNPRPQYNNPLLEGLANLEGTPDDGQQPQQPVTQQPQPSTTNGTGRGTPIGGIDTPLKPDPQPIPDPIEEPTPTPDPEPSPIIEDPLPEPENTTRYTMPELINKLQAQQKETQRLLNRAKFVNNSEAIKFSMAAWVRVNDIIEEIEKNDNLSATEAQKIATKIDLYIQSATQALEIPFDFE